MLKVCFVLLFVCCVTLTNTKATVKPLSFKDIDFVVNSQSTKIPKKRIPTTTKQPFQLDFDDVSFSINGSKAHQNGTEETANASSTGKKCNRYCRKLLPGRNRRKCCRRGYQSRKT